MRVLNFVADYIYSKAFENVSAEDIIKNISAWIDLEEPFPPDMHRGRELVEDRSQFLRPIEFLYLHHSPELIPLIIKREKIEHCNIDTTKKKSILFETKQLTTDEQERILTIWNFKLSALLTNDDETTIALHEVVQHYPNIPSELLTCFIKHHIDINTPDAMGNTALLLALKCHYFGTASALIDLGANLDAANQHGVSPRNYIAQQAAIFSLFKEILSFVFRLPMLPIPSIEEFEWAIKNFCEKYQTTLPKLFGDSTTNPALKMALMCEPTIVAYLSRSDFEMGMEEYPEYSELEKELYVVLSEEIELDYHIPFRTNKKRDNNFIIKDTGDSVCYKRFYNIGTPQFVISFQIGEIAKLLKPTDPIHLINNATDVRMFVDLLRALSKAPDLRTNDAGIAFAITPLLHGMHYACILSVLSSKEKKVDYHILINSINDEIFRNKLITDLDIEMKSKLHIVSRKEHAPVLLDASLELQTEKSDLNCGIYALEISRAAVMALQDDPVLGDKLSNLTLEQDQVGVIEGWHQYVPSEYLRYRVKNTNEWLQTQKLLKHGISKNADLFYENDGATKSYDSRKLAFISRRWNYGQSFFCRQLETNRRKLAQQAEQLEKLRITLCAGKIL